MFLEDIHKHEVDIIVLKNHIQQSPGRLSLEIEIKINKNIIILTIRAGMTITTAQTAVKTDVPSSTHLSASADSRLGSASVILALSPSCSSNRRKVMNLRLWKQSLFS